MAEDKLGKLHAAGVVKGSIPQEYKQVLEDLSDDEVDVILSVKDRLDRAGASGGRPKDEMDANFIVI
jgi:hypothetical protein